MSSHCVELNDWPIWYDIYGSGDIPVLLVPGAIGTGKTDFYEQLEGDDILDDKRFTIIAIELPGCGRSRPPARRYGTMVYDIDSECMRLLMQYLGYEKFVVIAWSEGATAALWMACKYPQLITKMVMSGIIAYPDHRTLATFKKLGKVEDWPQSRINIYLRAYGSRQEVQQLWEKRMTYFEHMKTYFPTDPLAGKYDKIKFPVLVIQGDKDPISPVEHSEHIRINVKTSVVKRFPNGGHDFHQRYSQVYKQLVEEFILSNKPFRLEAKVSESPNGSNETKVRDWLK